MRGGGGLMRGGGGLMRGGGEVMRGGGRVMRGGGSRLMHGEGGRLMRGAALLGRLLLAAILPAAWLAGVPSPGLAAQDTHDVARLTGEIGVDPEPGSLLATTARLSIEQLPLAEALVRLAEHSRVQIAFSPSLLPPDRVVDCDCATKTLRARWTNCSPAPTWATWSWDPRSSSCPGPRGMCCPWMLPSVA